MKFFVTDKDRFVKLGKRLAGLPPRSVRTYKPDGWDPSDINAFQQAAMIWRTGTPWTEQRQKK